MPPCASRASALLRSSTTPHRHPPRAAPLLQTLLSGVVPGSHPLRLSPRKDAAPAPKRLVVVDANVADLWGAAIRAYFAAHRADLRLLVLPTWEDNKNFELVFRVAAEIESVKLNRRCEPLIAIGGGVCLDVCGLAANLFRRNTPVIKVPRAPCLLRPCADLLPIPFYCLTPAIA